MTGGYLLLFDDRVVIERLGGSLTLQGCHRMITQGFSWFLQSMHAHKHYCIENRHVVAHEYMCTTEKY